MNKKNDDVRDLSPEEIDSILGRGDECREIISHCIVKPDGTEVCYREIVCGDYKF
ncbi:hypothetical protein [Agarilytica rhodophyticola]|uniref:hypothetical protein n=1 Tax=Agarilytica rhodophyticola TaxID=1737490 RepID=UPI001319FC29|nr:hypothetical protein [Agarilytica rhodophyticola]